MRKNVAAMWIIAAPLLLCLLSGCGGGEARGGYRFVTVERGDIESVVSATGNLEAVTTVQVGTQVSGIIAEIFVDFNDRVEENQVIARLDTTLLQSAIREAEANLERARAQFDHAKREYERTSDLYEKAILSESEYNTARYDFESARASLTASEVSLEKGRQNLSYATVLAPISGTVIERNVEVGQTVASSFSAPQLFLLAADLSRMQILASVDESDIGVIEEGQKVRFTVQAFSDETFEGTVRQVRLQSTIQENVVNYTVVIDAANEEGRLLPGMTATVEFLVESAEDVLKVPNAALRFRPTEAMVAEMRARREREQTVSKKGSEDRQGDGSPGRFAGREGGFPPGGSGREAVMGQQNFAMLWTVGDDGILSVVPVRTGITDGQYTEVRGRNLEGGMEIIAGVTQGSAEASVSKNPFQSREPRRRGPPPGAF